MDLPELVPPPSPRDLFLRPVTLETTSLMPPERQAILLSANEDFRKKTEEIDEKYKLSNEGIKVDLQYRLTPGGELVIYVESTDAVKRKALDAWFDLTMHALRHRFTQFPAESKYNYLLLQPDITGFTPYGIAVNAKLFMDATRIVEEKKYGSVAIVANLNYRNGFLDRVAAINFQNASRQSGAGSVGNRFFYFSDSLHIDHLYPNESAALSAATTWFDTKIEA